MADRVEHSVEGPLELRFGDDATLSIDRLTLSYDEVPKFQRRAWTLAFSIPAFHRAVLLELFEAGVSPLRPVDVLRLDIVGEIRFTWVPRAELAARLDAVEDAVGAVGSEGLHESVRDLATDLRAYEFESVVQG